MNRLEAVLGGAIVAVASLALTVELAGALHLLGAPFLLAAAALEWLAVRGWRVRLPPSQGGFGALPKAVRLLVVAVAALALPALLRALYEPPLDWDGNTYHLFYATRYLQSRNLVPLDYVHPHELTTYLPANGDLLRLAAMAVVQSDLLVKLPNLLFAALTAAATAQLARRLGAGTTAAACAGTLVATTPALAAWLATAYVEPLLDASLLAAIVFALRAVTDDRRQALGASALAGLATGVAAGTKYTALYFVVALAGTVLTLALRRSPRPRAAALRAGVFGSGLLLGGGFWYLRNALATGNPFFPVAFLGLPSIENEFFYWRDASLFSNLGSADVRSAALTAWFGGLGRAEPMTHGLKTVLVAPLALAAFGALAWRLVRPEATSTQDRAAPALILGSFVVLLYGYLALPYWGLFGWLAAGTRWAVPAYAVAIAATLWWLDRWVTRKAWLVAVTGVAMAADATHLDFRIPAPLPFDAWLAGGVALAALAFVAGRRQRAGARWGSAIAAGLAATLVLTSAWTRREARRYEDLARQSEVHRIAQQVYASVAGHLEHELAGQKLAATANGPLEFLYLFVGRRLDREVVYVMTHDGPRGWIHYPDGNPRRIGNREVWARNLAASGSRLLLTCRALAPDRTWPPETRWARELGFTELYADDGAILFRLPAPPAPVQSST